MALVSGTQIRPDAVAIYIRWSTDEQENGTTLLEQREGCEFYLRSQGWIVNPDLIFVDDGFSGGNLDRPGMEALRALVKDGKVDCVIVWKIDRLSRNIVNAVYLVLEEWRDRCHVKSVREPIDTTTELGRLIFSILATFADYERSVIRDRTHRGLLRRLSEGKAYGGSHIAFGLLPTGEPGVRQLDPERAPLVAEMFRKVADERATVAVLVEWLTKEKGVAGPNGTGWRHKTVLEMLRNPIYAGRIVYGRTLPGGKQGRRNRKREQPVVNVPATTVPAIVSQELFDRVQIILDERSERHKVQRRYNAGSHLLTGIARCKCGARMHAHFTHTALAYKCSRQTDYGKSGCPDDCGQLSQAMVEHAIVADLLRLFGQRDYLEEAVAHAAQQSEENTKSIESERASASAQVSRLEKKLEDLADQKNADLISLDEWRTLKESAERNLARLKDRLQTLEIAHQRGERDLADRHTIAQYMNQCHRWDALAMIDKKELLRTLAEEIVLFKPKGRNQPYHINVKWRFAPQPRFLEASPKG